MEDFTVQDGKVLIREARRAIELYLKNGRVSRAQLPQEMDRPLGVFVTLKKHRPAGERLRGCIGFPEPIYELSRGLAKAAVSAAFSDPRFPPVGEEELPDISIEVSLLSSPRLLDVPKRELSAAVVVGKHGIIIERGISRGLLLPQVAIEENCDSESFLALGCLKAGLPPDAWLDKKVNVYVFTARVFGEVEPGGDVVEIAMGPKR
jgi:hypothetical protein